MSTPTGVPDALEALVYDPPTPAKATIIVLHGLGADGNDFVPIAGELNLSAVGPVRFIFPHAPVIPVTINNGYRMRAWYDILGTDLVRREDEAGLRSSAASISALIDQERASGMPSDKIVLMGFSQGCAMTLLTGLRYPHRLAGLVGLSGYLPLASTLAAEAAPANRETPIFLAHGTLDPVVPLARGEAARDQLKAAGYPLDWHTYPMQHSVSPEEITDLEAFLLKVLG